MVCLATIRGPCHVVPTEIEGREKYWGYFSPGLANIPFNFYFSTVFWLSCAGFEYQFVVSKVGEGFCCVRYWEGLGDLFFPFLSWYKCWPLLIRGFEVFLLLLDGIVSLWITDMVVGKLCGETGSGGCGLSGVFLLILFFWFWFWLSLTRFWYFFFTFDLEAEFSGLSGEFDVELESIWVSYESGLAFVFCLLPFFLGGPIWFWG